MDEGGKENKVCMETIKKQITCLPFQKKEVELQSLIPCLKQHEFKYFKKR